MAPPRSSRSARAIRLSALLASLLLVSGLTLRLSLSLMSRSPAARVTSGLEAGLEISSAAAGPLFDDVVLVGGQRVEACTTVAVRGTPDPDPIALVIGGFTGDAALAEALLVEIQYGTPDVPATCEGFVSSGVVAASTLADLASAHADPDSAIPTWDPPVGQASVAYRFVVTLPEDAPEELRGTSVDGWSLTWGITDATAARPPWVERSLTLLVSTTERSIIPLLLMLVVAILFLGIQDRIDGRDPKLALAPVRTAEVPFEDPVAIPDDRPRARPRAP